MEMREVGNVLMIAGVSAFLAGFGINATAEIVEGHKRKLIYKARKNEENLLFEKANHEATNAKILAEAEREIAYKSRLQSMSDKEFAKHHAEAIAKANDDVMTKANNIEKEAKASIVSAKLECTEKINKANAECLAKIEEAQKKAEEATRKYEEINKLFTNKDDILKAKRELEWLNERSQRAQNDKDELSKRISLILS